jgi:hypothetical protein
MSLKFLLLSLLVSALSVEARKHRRHSSSESSSEVKLKHQHFVPDVSPDLIICDSVKFLNFYNDQEYWLCRLNGTEYGETFYDQQFGGLYDIDVVPGVMDPLTLNVKYDPAHYAVCRPLREQSLLECYWYNNTLFRQGRYLGYANTSLADYDYVYPQVQLFVAGFAHFETVQKHKSQFDAVLSSIAAASFTLYSCQPYPTGLSSNQGVLCSPRRQCDYGLVNAAIMTCPLGTIPATSENEKYYYCLTESQLKHFKRNIVALSKRSKGMCPHTNPWVNPSKEGLYEVKLPHYDNNEFPYHLDQDRHLVRDAERLELYDGHKYYNDDESSSS